MHTAQAETGEIPSTGTAPPVLMMAGQKGKKMEKYIVVDQIGNDDYSDVFDTIEAANEFALKSWKHLTNREKNGRHIYVCEVTENDLQDWAVDEETGEIDWRCFFQSNLPADGFDSTKYEEQLAREEEERFQEEEKKWAEWEKSLEGDENGRK